MVDEALEPLPLPSSLALDVLLVVSITDGTLGLGTLGFDPEEDEPDDDDVEPDEDPDDDEEDLDLAIVEVRVLINYGNTVV